ncbi:DNA-directed RNA polymerase II subunit [Entophlyctis sp. JEL0112]|nr:DNA-directed RNA polymerase II subunit [Entophlyctis sp. JEL0112]
MLFLKELSHTILLHPQFFGPRLAESLRKRLYDEVEGTCSGLFGYIIAVIGIVSTSKGVLQTASGYAEFVIVYKAIVFKPFKGQVVEGVVTTVNRFLVRRTIAFTSLNPKFELKILIL